MRIIHTLVIAVLATIATPAAAAPAAASALPLSVQMDAPGTDLKRGAVRLPPADASDLRLTAQAATAGDAERLERLAGALGVAPPRPAAEQDEPVQEGAAQSTAGRMQALSSALGVAPPTSAQASPGGTGTAPAADAGDAGGALGALGRLGQSLGLGGQPEFLDPEVAFTLDSRAVDADTVQVRFAIEDDYYLYRNKFRFEVVDSDAMALGPAAMPPGKVKPDPYFGDVEVHYGEAVATVPLQRTAAAGSTLQLRVHYQGCADAGLCYPPMDRVLAVALPAAFTPVEPLTAAASAVVSVSAAPGARAAASGGDMVSEQDQLTGILLSGNLWAIIAVFFGAGLLLSFTPCVLPMIPILSSIIVGQGEHCSRRRALGLSFVYVQGMAITYTVAGMAAGMTGANVQAMFQDPYVLVTFAAVFVALALSMFGFYDLQIPAGLQARLTRLSNRQRSGSFAGAGVMGVLSALIVGPCVAPPLIGALGYISQTGDPLLGGLALYALSMGMGVPLLAVGASAGQLLPRAGAWMQTVKAVFGVVLLAVAIYFLDRVVPDWVIMLLWAGLFIVTAIYMGALDHIQDGMSGWRRLWKGVGLVMLVYGVLLMVGAAGGNNDPLQPLRGLAVAGGGGPAHAEELPFRRVKGVDGLQAALDEARAQGRPVMLDYYADWCVSCIEMERFTFSDPGVQSALANVVLLQTDVTANDETDKALLRRYGLLGPPTIQFFLPDGRERRNFRVVGFMDAEKFRAHVLRALAG